MNRAEDITRPAEPLGEGSACNRSFNRAELIDLWKYFEGVGNQAKTQMVSTAGWLLAIIGGILSTVVATLGFPLCSKNPQQALVFGTAGTLICVICLLMIWEYREHTYRNWWRATRCKSNIAGLHELVTGHRPPSQPISDTPDRFKPEGRVASVFGLYQGAALVSLMLLVVSALLPMTGVMPRCETQAVATAPSEIR